MVGSELGRVDNEDIQPDFEGVGTDIKSYLFRFQMGTHVSVLVGGVWVGGIGTIFNVGEERLFDFFFICWICWIFCGSWKKK